MAEEFEHARFLENLNAKFRLSLEAGASAELELAEVSDLKTGPGQEWFSIVLREGSERILPQRTYQVDSDTMGSMEIFIVPIRKTDEGVFYEAVFNRPLNKPE